MARCTSAPAHRVVKSAPSTAPSAPTTMPSLSGGHTRQRQHQHRRSRHGNFVDHGQWRHSVGRWRQGQRYRDHRQRDPGPAPGFTGRRSAGERQWHHHYCRGHRQRRHLTVNGNIDIGANSHVQGGINVHKPSTGFFHWWSDSDKPRVVVGPGCGGRGRDEVRSGRAPVCQRHRDHRPGDRGDPGQILRRPARPADPPARSRRPCSCAVPSEYTARPV